MAYFSEDAVKAPLLQDISSLARALDVVLIADEIEALPLEALQAMHRDMLTQYQKSMFDSIATEIVHYINQ